MEKFKDLRFAKIISKVFFVITSFLLVFTMLEFFIPNKAYAFDPSKPLIIKYNVPSSKICYLPITSGTSISVDWGDGSDIQDYYDSGSIRANSINGINAPYHIYDTTGVKTIKITGSVNQFGFISTSSAGPKNEPYKSFVQNLVGLDSWGEVDCTRYSFSHCENLEGAIPAPSANTFAMISEGNDDLFLHNPSSNIYYWYGDIGGGFNNLFYNCKKITSIPSGLFASAPQVKNFSQIFSGCTSLESIPSDIFSNNKEVVTFRNVFEGCTEITSIPEDLFKNNTKVLDFFGAFAGTGITSIPAGLFSSNTNAVSFEKTFYECEDLKTISMSMFSKNTSAENFKETFACCYSLNVSITPELFKNVAVEGPEDGNTVGEISNCGSSDRTVYLFVGSDSSEKFYDAFCSTFELCPNIKDVSLDTPFVGYHMFWGDNLVVNITLSSSVKRMGKNCFYAANPSYYKNSRYVSKDYEGYYHNGEKSYTEDKLLRTYLESNTKVTDTYKWYDDNRGFKDPEPEKPADDIEITGGPYIYDGDPHRPIIIINDIEYKPTQDESTITTPEGNIYIVTYKDNIDAGTGTVIVKDATGKEVKTYNFIIKPAVIPVDWTDRTFKYDGKPHVPKGTATKGVIKGETLVLKISGEKIEVGEKYPAEAILEKVEGGRGKTSNYELDPTTIKTTFNITKDEVVDADVAIYISNGSKNKDKGNQNYYRLKEEVIYYIEWENLGDDFTSDYEVTFETPLEFDIVDEDEGTVDEDEKTITWKIQGGMKEGDTEKRTVKLKYTSLSKKSLDYEKIYPFDRIFINDDEKDRAAVINVIYKDGATIEGKHILYMLGDAEKPTFRPDDGISRAEGALVLTRIFEMDYLNTTVRGDEFSDLNTTYSDAQKAIVKATKLGLISGYSDGTYRPNGKMTRAEFMTILAKYVEYNAQQERIKGIQIKEVEDSELYKKAKHWSAKYVVFLNRLNLGQDGVGLTDSEMDTYIERCEVAELCNKYLFRSPVYDDGKNDLPFTDVPRSHRLYGHIVEATRPSHNDFRLTEDSYEIWD